MYIWVVIGLVSEPGFDFSDGIWSMDFRYRRVRRAISKNYHLHAPHLYFPCQMDPYAVNMMPGTSMATYISLLHASIIAHEWYPFSEFHSIKVHAHILLWYLPMVDSQVEFRLRYHHFMMTETQVRINPGSRSRGLRLSLLRSCY